MTKGRQERLAYAPIPLLDRTVRYIDEEREDKIRERRKRDKSYRPNHAVFIGRVRQPIRPNQMSETFKNAFRKTQIKADLHCLRHTYAIRTLHVLQQRANAGEALNPLLTLKVRLGHRRIQSTMIYLQSLSIRPEAFEEDLVKNFGEVIEDLEAEQT